MCTISLLDYSGSNENANERELSRHQVIFASDIFFDIKLGILLLRLFHLEGCRGISFFEKMERRISDVNHVYSNAPVERKIKKNG